MEANVRHSKSLHNLSPLNNIKIENVCEKISNGRWKISDLRQVMAKSIIRNLANIVFTLELWIHNFSINNIITIIINSSELVCIHARNDSNREWNSQDVATKIEYAGRKVFDKWKSVLKS